MFVVQEIGPNRHLKDTRNLNDPLMNVSWSARDNVKANLLPLSLAMNSHLMRINTPSDYSASGVRQIDSSFHETDYPQLGHASLPDVVIVLSESFFNLNRFPDLKFNTDPTPSFTHEEVKYGADVVSSAFGGGTANVEFELLTGLRTASLPIGSIPYLQYVQRDLPVSLPNYLKKIGYETIGIHPFDGNFWKRKEVYPHLGIDRFIDESGFVNPERKGPFISDLSFARKILEELDDNHGKPKFIFAASMENHGSYDDPARYSEMPVRSLNPATPAMKVVLDNYANGMHDADASMAYLADAVRHRSRPTVFVFFGDHLSIPLYMLVDAKQISSDNYDLVTPEEQKKIHTVQALLISNQENVRWPERHFQMNDMAPQLMQAAGIPVSPYWNLVDEMSHEVPAHIFEFSEDAHGKVTYAKDLQNSVYQRQLNLLSFDLMFGDQHIVRNMNKHYEASIQHPVLSTPVALNGS